MSEKAGKKGRYQHSQFAQEQKRSLIDSLEAMRGGSAAVRSENRQQVVCPQEEGLSQEAMQVELDRLQEELRMSKSTNAVLENDLRRMEQKALDTIAENGQLKQCIDKARQNGRLSADAEAEEKALLLGELAQARNDHFMLTQALIDSENEIGRLTLALEKATRKLCAA